MSPGTGRPTFSKGVLIFFPFGLPALPALIFLFLIHTRGITALRTSLNYSGKDIQILNKCQSSTWADLLWIIYNDLNFGRSAASLRRFMLYLTSEGLSFSEVSKSPEMLGDGTVFIVTGKEVYS